MSSSYGRRNDHGRTPNERPAADVQDRHLARRVTEQVRDLDVHQQTVACVCDVTVFADALTPELHAAIEEVAEIERIDSVDPGGTGKPAIYIEVQSLDDDADADAGTVQGVGR